MSDEELKMEQEANYFAMCLLMPEEFVRAEVSKMNGLNYQTILICANSRINSK